MAATEETRILGWRLLVVVGAVALTVFSMVLTMRAAFTRDEPRTTSTGTFVAAPIAPTESVTTILVNVTPLASGDVTVTEVVTNEPPLASLELRPPVTSPPDGDTVPPVLDLTVDAGEVRVPVANESDTVPPTVALPARSKEIIVSYTLEGAAAQRATAPEGRALVQVRPLSYDVGADEANVVIRINGVAVRNVVCPDLPLEEQLCGRESGGRWQTIELPADMSTMVAQVDLPES